MEIRKPTEAGCTLEACDKDTKIPIETAFEIQRWINDNFCKFTDAEITAKFNKTIPELWAIYQGKFTVNYPKFSYYKAPVRNTQPTKEIDILQLFNAITGDYYKQITQTFRAMPGGQEKANFKTSRFDHVTFAGTFTSRKTENLKALSGYACFDFDHVPEVDELKNLLIADESLDVQLLFTSPSGDGLKMIIYNDRSAPYDHFYNGVSAYLKACYPTISSSLDAKTKDIARTCFICHDENAFIKPQYLELWQTSKN